MNIDINALMNALKEASPYINIAISAWKQLKDLLPEGPKRTEAIEAIKALENAERQLKLAETQTMQSLGYELCRNHEIPEIMQSKDDKIWICPKCNNKKDKRVFATSSVSRPR